MGDYYVKVVVTGDNNSNKQVVMGVTIKANTAVDMVVVNNNNKQVVATADSMHHPAPEAPMSSIKTPTSPKKNATSTRSSTTCVVMKST